MDAGYQYVIGALQEQNDRELLSRVARLCPTDFSREDIEQVRHRVANILSRSPDMDHLEQVRMVGAIIFDVQRMLRVNLEV